MRAARIPVAALLLGAFLLLGGFLARSPAASALTRRQADALALAVLRPQAAGRYAVVYGFPAVLRAGTTVSAAGPGPGQRWRVVRTSGGVELTARVPRTKLRTPGWLFWEDARAGVAFPHPSRLLLLDGVTGRVVWMRTIDWYPLVNDRTAAFYRSYRGKDYLVFARGAAVVHAFRAPAAARPSARAAPAAYKDACLVKVNDPSHANDGANFAGDAAAMQKFANDYGFGDKTGTAGSADELEAEVARLVRKGCKDVVVLVAGHGAPAEGQGATSEPTVVVGSHVAPTADGGQETVIDRAITLPDLQALVSKFDPEPKEPGKPPPEPKVKFKFVIDSCFSGRFAELGSQDGVRFIGTSSQADEFSVMSTALDSSLGEHLDGSTWYVTGVVTELRNILEGKNPNVDAQAVQSAKDDLVFALTLAADQARLPGTGADKAAALGLDHPSVVNNTTEPGSPSTLEYEYSFGPVTGTFTDDGGGTHTVSISGTACGKSPLTVWKLEHTLDGGRPITSPTVDTPPPPGTNDPETEGADFSKHNPLTIPVLLTRGNDPARTIIGSISLVLTLNQTTKPAAIEFSEKSSGGYTPGGIASPELITDTLLAAGKSCP